MNPEVMEAIDRLAAEGVLPPDAAPRLRRVASGELLSLRPELRALLYAGATLIAAGAAEFVRLHYREIGPVAITAALSLAAAAAFAYVFRRARPFSRGAVPSPTLAFDYVLLLAVLLFGSDLAYVESQFRPLGSDWPFQLLLFSLVALAAAYRFDSATVLSLALASFAAWRGVTVRDPLGVFFGNRIENVRANSIACGVLFLAGALAAAKWKIKPHFEPVWGNLGLALLFGGLISGALGASSWLPWAVALLAVSGAVAALAVRAGRELYAALAIVAGYAGAMRIVLHPLRSEVVALALIAFSAAVVLALLLRLHRSMRKGNAA